ncbi:TolB-like translocation protein [Flocculibacter collagenilyticus]|uniref:PD40 domain-containing protein n=1 Tax=Flocculibacter collagenilyticus TaxID=2744479 RepID=UPI0018F605FB|nr:PD40 domain-containing protein [Flocculibacter collagenilyticus]
MKRISIVFLFSLVVLGCGVYSQRVSSVPEGPYLGQKPPGSTPELFAPDIIQTEYREGAYAIPPQLDEFYIRRRGGEHKSNTLVVVQYKSNQWIESVISPKSGEPFISPDGKVMHLGKKYRERTDTGWSDVKSLGAPFEDYRIMRLTASSSGTYYFDEASKSGPIRYSRFIDGKREAPKAIDIKMGDWNAHPFIAPDESYLIWDDQGEGGYGSSDLYISFRKDDGSWGAAINLGDKINSEFEDAYGSVSPDGKYFFFLRSYGGNKADIYWVDAQVIKALKPI